MTNRFDNRVFVIDKVPGPTSFEIVAALRRVSGLRRVGHAGTLDALARGVLLVCTGHATRAVEHFMNLEKEYRFDVRLGVETTTLDAEGDVVREAPVPPLTIEEMRAAAAQFVGDYVMVPPTFSALKLGGRRFSDLARAGEPAEASPRTVRVHAFDVVSVELPIVHCVVRCSRGTYVRALARDLGAKLGLPASIASLARSRIGNYRVEDAVSSECLVPERADEVIGLDLGEALSFLPGVVVSTRAKRALLFGAAPLRNDVVETVGAPTIGAIAGPLRILDEEGTLLAIGTRGGDHPRDPLRVCDSFRLFVEASPGGTGAGAARVSR
ncbi:MAG TPA: tRNA pseudouridine(55) synthase TruB [Candidatus Krumholzibacteria bacterium]|nr:tRNA pseudouridine(55) synthase TruB [Candidatus Krumholzibacteria bacterium]